MENCLKKISSPQKLPLSNVENIAAGPLHSYAITPDGLYGWGNNSNLNLGTQTKMSCVHQPLLLNLKVTNISTCSKHTFAWNQQQVYGWGSNYKRQLGLQQQKNYPITKLEIFKEAAQNNIRFIQFSCGQSHSLAIMKKSHDASKAGPLKKVLFGWGSSQQSQLPLDSNKIIPYPVMLEFQNEVDHIYSISDYSLLISEGKVYSWGNDVFGRLGIQKVQRNQKTKRIPRLVPLQKIVTIGIGKVHVIAVNSEGGVFSWGGGMHGQLGVGAITSSNAPLKISLDQIVISASCGEHHSLFLTNKQQIYSCGSNSQGCLGHQKNLNEKKRSFYPQKIDIQGIVKICSGYNHNMALSKHGKIYSWGDNSYGQLGLKLMSEMPSEQEQQSSQMSLISPKPKHQKFQEWYKKYNQFKKAKEEEEKLLLAQLQQIMSNRYQQ